ncbi:MAG: sporulation protein YqfD, partial [Acutalibacteraceae bacterium]|nr:sporulation protein YqfD [Acutalibacteraceae bacterium]
MFMLYLLRLITGYVKFRAAGRFPERFMNLCATNGLVIWDPEMQDGVLYGYMSLSDYKKIR